MSRTSQQINLSGRVVVFESLKKRSPDFFVRMADTIYTASPLS